MRKIVSGKVKNMRRKNHHQCYVRANCKPLFIMNVEGVTHGPGPMFASKRLKTDPRKMPFKSA